MPAITAITLRFSRKFQISRDDWIGADALVTVAVGEEEAESADPAEIRRIAIAEARQVVIESIAAEYLERTQLAARAHAGQLPAGQTAVAATAADRTADVVGAPLVGAPPPLVGALPAANGAANDATPPPAPIANGRPATAEEAERRFFARYSEIVGGESWLDVWAYLGTRAPKPATVEGW